MELSNLPLRVALNWCESKSCCCLGCANRSGGYNGNKEDWKKEIDVLLKFYGHKGVDVSVAL